MQTPTFLSMRSGQHNINGNKLVSPRPSATYMYVHHVLCKHGYTGKNGRAMSAKMKPSTHEKEQTRLRKVTEKRESHMHPFVISKNRKRAIKRPNSHLRIRSRQQFSQFDDFLIDRIPIPLFDQLMRRPTFLPEPGHLHRAATRRTRAIEVERCGHVRNGARRVVIGRRRHSGHRQTAHCGGLGRRIVHVVVHVVYHT